MKITITIFNIFDKYSTRVDIRAILYKQASVIVALQKILISSLERKVRHLGYTIIEYRWCKKTGFWLTHALREDIGLIVSEIKSVETLMVG